MILVTFVLNGNLKESEKQLVALGLPLQNESKYGLRVPVCFLVFSVMSCCRNLF